MEQWKQDAFNHAVECQPFECCGILAKNNGKLEFWKCKNIAKDNPEYSFVIDPLDWALCEDSVEEIVGIIHSHPEGKFEFSENDIASCNYLDIPFYLVDPTTQSIINIEPKKL